MNGYCKICGGYLWSSERHTCPPKFECRFDETWKDDRDWCATFAPDAEHAAERFAERHDCENEYSILQQGDRYEQAIEVRDAGGIVTFWKITAESIPRYYAEQIVAD